MIDFYTGAITTIIIIGLLEVFKSFDKRLIGAFTLVGISFIYIGFSWQDIPSLAYTIISVIAFLALSYYGYKNNFNLIVLGLILHGIWDVLFSLLSSTIPEGYDVFCITIDFLLATYFFVRVKPKNKII